MRERERERQSEIGKSNITAITSSRELGTGKLGNKLSFILGAHLSLSQNSACCAARQGAGDEEEQGR